MGNRFAFIWFMLGIGSKLQLVASLSITELVVLVFAPFIFMKNYRQMRRDGVMTFFVVALLVVVGCAVACVANQSHPMAVLRGMATTCLIACSIVFSHWIIRKDPSGFKWMFAGVAFSSVMSTFYFQNAVELADTGGDVDLIVAGPIFWIQRVGAFVMMPLKGWYIHMPIVVIVVAPLFMAAFSMLSSTSGRSLALTAIAFVSIALIGGKRRCTMMRVARNFWPILCIGGVGILAIHRVYKISAMQGWLGEESRRKYEIQSHGENSIGRLLLGGRAESFIGLLACRDKPIVGWGPWAIDTKGYREEFMTKYGTMEDVMDLYKSQQWLSARGVIKDKLIQCHAYITEFWLWYGIFGLLFWVYVMFVLLRYLRQDCFAVPQWFGWLACSIPGIFWGIFFSPFADRFGVPMFVVACLMARAVRKGAFLLPVEMVEEIEMVERR